VEGATAAYFRDTAEGTTPCAKNHSEIELLAFAVVAEGFLPNAATGSCKGRLHKFPGPLFLLAQTRHQSPFLSILYKQHGTHIGILAQG
jgi:hypothetical protein